MEGEARVEEEREVEVESGAEEGGKVDCPCSNRFFVVRFVNLAPSRLREEIRL